MQPQEQGLIDGLLDRLKQAQARDSKRDQQAAQLSRHRGQYPALQQSHALLTLISLLTLLSLWVASEIGSLYRDLPPADLDEQ